MIEPPAALLLGDCLEIMAKMQPGSVGLLLSDMPYGNSRHSWDKPIDLDQWWMAVRRVLRPGAAAILHSQGLLTGLLLTSNPRWYRHTLIWQKNTTSGHLNARRAPLRSHEEILVFCGRQPIYHPQMWEGQPSHRRGSSQSSQKFYGTHAGIDNMETVGSTAKYPRSVVAFDCVPQAQHLVPSQKPTPLLAWLIRTYSNPGDRVLDPCMGAASTLVAARQEGRPSVGIEIDPRRYAIAANRLHPMIEGATCRS